LGDGVSAGVTTLLGKRTLRLLAHRATGRPLPFSITFILTHRCNFACSYCDVPSAAGEEMSAAEYKDAIDELCDAGLARASFSGGEALLRREASEIIAHANRRGLVTSLNTNAWLAERHLSELSGILDVLVVSLDGPEREHDLARRQPGSYKRVVRVLEKARAAGIKTATITVLTGENLHVVDEVLDLSRRLGSYAYFQPAYSGCFERDRGLQPELGARVLADVAERLASSKRAGLPVGASPGYIERLGRAPRFGRCERCHAGRYFATLMPDGTLVPCHLTSRARAWPNGRTMGFAAAFRSLGRPPSGDGCAISPYQEADLVFGGDLRATRDAFARFFGR
jgi:MoaA/NifB/PqqE/SkfB family radical SAM enzyme